MIAWITKYKPMHYQIGTHAHDQLGRGTMQGHALLAACHRWLSKKKSIIPQKRDALLKECMSEHLTSEEGKALYHVRNSLTLRKGLMYMNIMPKGETEGLLAFVVPSAHRHTALNGVH